MVSRRYDGPPLDGSGNLQYITERPELDERDDDVNELDREAATVVYATPPEPPGEERTEGEPVINADGGDRSEGPDVNGQSTLADWGGGSA